MSSVRTILASLFTVLGGVCLLVLTAGAGFAIYIWTVPDSISAPANADAVANPPLFRPQSTALPRVEAMGFASAALTQAAAGRLPDTRSRPVDGAARIRQLQKALAQAGCYNGPVSGIWSDASKDAMRGFAESVNATLPVDNPDDALVALIESNDTATCARGRAISTGALAPEPQPSGQTSATTSVTAPITSDDEASILNRTWAPPAMLVPSKEVASETTETPVTVAPQKTASNDRGATDRTTLSDASTTLSFEGGAPLPAAQSAEPSSAPPKDTPEPSTIQPPKPKKTKTAKRRPAKVDDVETTISKGFDTLQRSFTSMF